MRTQEEIQAEINALKEIKPRVRKYTAFGDNNHTKIDAQIRVLEKVMSQDAIWEHWDGEDDSETLLEAEAAYAWMHGESESLVESWRPLAS